MNYVVQPEIEDEIVKQIKNNDGNAFEIKADVSKENYTLRTSRTACRYWQRLPPWLASDDADYINGTTIFVDGGMLLYQAFQQTIRATRNLNIVISKSLIRFNH